MDAQENEFLLHEVTHQSVTAQIKFATQPFLKQVLKYCALSDVRNDLDSAKLEITASRRDDQPRSSSASRYDSHIAYDR